MVPHWQKEINFILPTLTLKRTTETRRNRFVILRKAHKLELKTRKTFWLFRMRTLTPPSKSIISLPEPLLHCKRTLTVSHSTLPFISSFAWILTLLFPGEKGGVVGLLTARRVYQWAGGSCGLSEQQKKRAAFHQAYEWRFWDRWHYSNCWKCENVLDRMKEGLVEREGKNVVASNHRNFQLRRSLER